MHLLENFGFVCVFLATYFIYRQSQFLLCSIVYRLEYVA